MKRIGILAEDLAGGCLVTVDYSKKAGFPRIAKCIYSVNPCQQAGRPNGRPAFPRMNMKKAAGFPAAFGFAAKGRFIQASFMNAWQTRRTFLESFATSALTPVSAFSLRKAGPAPAPKPGAKVFLPDVRHLPKYWCAPDAGPHKIESAASAAPHIVANGIMLLGIQHRIGILQWAVTGKQFHTALPLQFHEPAKDLVILAVGTVERLFRLCRQRATDGADEILLFHRYPSLLYDLLFQIHSMLS